MLDLAQLQAGKLQLRLTDFNLHQAVQAVARLFAVAARAKDLELVAVVQPAVPDIVCGDGERLRQILSNLVSNSVKFTDRGRVTLRADVVGETATAVTVRFEVQDSGIGISPHVRERLFEPFSRGEHASTRYGGTGLGLAICRRLTDLLGGEIGVESTPGQGSTFWVDLSFAKPTPPTAARHSTASVAVSGIVAASNGRVLVVEDNLVNQKVAVRLLEKFGYGADVAANGREAIDAVARQLYAAVLMDCQLPEVDGFTATEQIRAYEAGRQERGRLPIIAMTTNVMPGDRERCLAAGMDDYLSKPVHAEQMRAVLRRWIPGLRLPRHRIP